MWKTQYTNDCKNARVTLATKTEVVKLMFFRRCSLKNPRVLKTANQQDYHLLGEWNHQKFEMLKAEAGDNSFVIVLTNGGSKKVMDIKELEWIEEDYAIR